MREGYTMKPGRERRKAWIYSAINPILEALKIESGFLAKRNWTFRQHSGDVEFIRPLEAYVDYQSRPNWEDFVASTNPAIRDKLKRRNEQREQLREACGVAFKYLVGVQEFQNKVSDCVVLSLPGGNPQLGQRPQDVVAELIVNNIGELPSHYGYQMFWSMFGGELKQRFRVGEAFTRADQAGRELKKSNDDLSKILTKVRSVLAAEYDIPWAPYYDESLSLPGH